MWRWESKEQAKGVVVIVHGAGEYHGRYEWVIRKLNESGFHCIMGDLPGQGTTTRRRGHIDSFDEYIETIEQWMLEANKYQLPVFLFGHSLGGLATIRAITEKRFTVHAVVLSSPCLGLVNPPSKGKEALSRVLNKIAPSVRFAANIEPESATRNEEVRLRDAEDTLLVKKVSVRWYRELVQAMKIANETVKRFPDVPLLIMQAGEDRIVNKYEVRGWFNRLELTEKAYKEYPKLYHEVLNEPERDDVFRYFVTYLSMHL
ncbi:alpha/beta hydrolase [Fictibacillus sp. Mic-4]|uniref:alpha/beta hydrolase n=1 Tax=Fictibacillus sp. Mic-4 TaxID=3132826 RepID=UPI003CE9CC25